MGDRDDTRTVNIHEAKTHLSRLIQDALRGERIIIAKGNVPLVELVVLESAKPARVLGGARGLVEIADDFDEALEDFDGYQ